MTTKKAPDMSEAQPEVSEEKVDESGRKIVGEEGLHISAAMAAELNKQGWTIDPATGSKVVREQ
jgi:hypothetical protein